MPLANEGKAFSLPLNWMNEQYDTAYWNGVEIGHSGNAPPDFYINQRRYNVPAKLVKAGRNVLAVRIVSATEKAGLWQTGKGLELPIPDPTSTDNQWLIRQESAFPPLPPDALANRPKPNNIPLRMVSGALYNGMIEPLLPYGIRGVIWYQGENNAGRSGEYRNLLSMMIADWRKQWGEGEFPFVIQQLVNFEEPPKDPNERALWPGLREAQTQVAQTVPNVAIAVGIDIGDANTIHPKNKQDVGAAWPSSRWKRPTAAQSNRADPRLNPCGSKAAKSISRSSTSAAA